MANLILIAGPPASGKSSFAEYAQKVLQYPLLCKDSYKEVLFDYVGFKSHAEKYKLNDASLFCMLYSAERLLEVGCDVMLENNFEHNSEEALQNLIAKTGCNVVSVLFTGDTRVMYDRFISRAASPDRHPAHTLSMAYPPIEGVVEPNIQATYEDYSQQYQKRGMLDFSMTEDPVLVDVTDFTKVDYDEIIGRIKAKLQ